MKTVETFFKPSNIDFFLGLETCNRIGVCASAAGITPQHASRLLRSWRLVGWIEKRPTLHGSKFFLTKQGRALRDVLETAKVVLNGNL